MARITPRRRRWAMALLLLVALPCGLIAWRDTTADPLVRTARVELPGLPASAGSLRVVLIADIHVAGPVEPPERVAALVRRVNALRPDIVLLAGDYLGYFWPRTRRYTMREALAPLAALRPRLGTVAVLGNHDHNDRPAPEEMPSDLHEPKTPAQRELEAIGIPVLINQARRVGPVTIVGRDIEGAGRWGSWQLEESMKAIGTPYVGLSHRPLGAAMLPDAVHVVLAGHSHCGQIDLPLLTRHALAWPIPFRYECGRVDEEGRTMIVTGGVGVSDLPVRFRVPPDIWLITLMPPPPGRQVPPVPAHPGPIHTRF